MGADIKALPSGEYGSRKDSEFLSGAAHAKFLPCRLHAIGRKLSDYTIYMPAVVTSSSLLFLYAGGTIYKIRDVANYPSIQFVSVGPSTSSTRLEIVWKQ